MPRRGAVAEHSHGPVVGLSTVSCGSRAMEGVMGVRLGGWRRMMPFLFSLPPRRHELCGSAKYVAMPGSSRSSACRANSVPLSCVTPVWAAAGSRENMAFCAATLAAAVLSGTIAAVFCQIEVVQNGVSIQSEKAAGFSPVERKDPPPLLFGFYPIRAWVRLYDSPSNLMYFVKLRWTCSALNLNTFGVQLEHRRRLVPCFVVCLVYFMRECLFR